MVQFQRKLEIDNMCFHHEYSRILIDPESWQRSNRMRKSLGKISNSKINHFLNHFQTLWPFANSNSFKLKTLIAKWDYFDRILNEFPIIIWIFVNVLLWNRINNGVKNQIKSWLFLMKSILQFDRFVWLKWCWKCLHELSMVVTTQVPI